MLHGYANELRYENPMLELRRNQLGWLEKGVTDDRTLQEIFESIPKNFRAIFMLEREFDKARITCSNQFVPCLKTCLVYCIQVIG